MKNSLEFSLPEINGYSLQKQTNNKKVQELHLANKRERIKNKSHHFLKYQ